MQAVFLLLGLSAVVAIGLVVAGRLPAVPQPTDPPRTPALPERPTVADLAALRFPVVARGYRMKDVDEALSVLGRRIAELEQPTGVDD